MTEVPEDQTRDLEKGAKEMEEGLDRLESDIETAHDRADEQRERANPEAAAGDWEDESAGAYQGADAVEAGETDTRDTKDGDGDGEREASSVDDVPVHESERVDPEGDG